MSESPIRFERILKARFVDRPNRFLVRCREPALGRIEAFLPNPGRMWELFLPGVTTYVIPEAPSPTRRTRYTAVAVERDGEPVFLHTHLTNHVARFLIEQRRIPGLEEAEVVASEVTHGHSRFDFLLRKGGREVFMEVKSCTLFGNEVGMFPDAITDRGRRHLLELADLGSKGHRHVALIVCQGPHLRWFMPDYHTDLAFSQAFLSVRDRVQIVPVSIGWNNDLSLMDDVRLLDVPWGYLRREVKDRGSYLLLLKLRRRRRVSVGRLGSIAFEKGYYIYVGSAMRNLSARIARHLRMRKRFHWHIDYLRQVADSVTPLPIRSCERLECRMGEALSSFLRPGPDGFGASDCNCPTHLFRSDETPLHSRPFHGLLQRFRMRHPT